VEAALQRVRWLGGESVGLVFNRASQHDLKRSHSVAGSLSVRSIADTRDRGGKRDSPMLRALGSETPHTMMGKHQA